VGNKEKLVLWTCKCFCKKACWGWLKTCNLSLIKSSEQASGMCSSWRAEKFEGIAADNWAIVGEAEIINAHQRATNKWMLSLNRVSEVKAKSRRIKSNIFKSYSQRDPRPDVSHSKWIKGRADWRYKA
jgi:hypothetical protein